MGGLMDNMDMMDSLEGGAVCGKLWIGSVGAEKQGGE
jgi:hypothetical protein